jgi:hypothetical protein
MACTTIMARCPLSYEQQHLFLLSQALDDAIVLRRARVAGPCSDCSQAPAGQRCDEHACDMSLISKYERKAAALAVTISQATERARQRHLAAYGGHRTV